MLHCYSFKNSEVLWYTPDRSAPFEAQYKAFHAIHCTCMMNLKSIFVHFMFYWRRTDLQYQLIIIILLWKITIEINIRLNVQPYIRNTKHWVIFWWTFLSNTDVKIKHKICYLMLASFFSYLLFYLLLISFYVRDKDMFIIHKQLKFFKTFQESYFGHTAWKM